MDNICKDAMLEEFNVKMIKIDTEGFDLSVLKGGKHILAKTHFVVVEGGSKGIRNFLIDSGFNIQKLETSNYLLGANIPKCAHGRSMKKLTQSSRRTFKKTKHIN